MADTAGTAVPANLDRPGAAGRTAGALLVAGRSRLLRQPGRLRRDPPGVPRLSGRAPLRHGAAHSRPPQPQRPRAGPDPAQRRGLHTVRAQQPRLRPAVEQPCCGARRVRRQRHPVDGRPGPGDRLLHHHRISGADPVALRGRDRARAPPACVGQRILAVQAALPQPRGAAGGRARAPASRAAPVGHRDRLLPLDRDGRLQARPRRISRSQSHDAGTRRDGRAPDGVHLADRVAEIGELRSDARPRIAARLRPGT